MFGAKKPAFALLATNDSINGYGRVRMVTSSRTNNPSRDLCKDFRHGHRRRKRGLRRDSQSVITGRVSIANRPVIVQSRKRIGDIEVDLMMGKHDLSQSIRRILYKATFHLHTLTFNGDKAFSVHKAIGIVLGLETYFTRPYTSQDNGTVENRIGQIRRFFQKSPTIVKYPIIVSDKLKNSLTTDL